MAKKQKSVSSRSNKQIESREKPLYYTLITLLIVYVLQNIFLDITILNKPLRLMYIVITILTLTSIFLSRKHYLFLGLEPAENLKTRIMVLSFNTFKYIVAFGIIYFTSLFMLFNVYIKYISAPGTTEYYTVPITQIHSGSAKSGPSVGFYFQGEYNILSGSQFREILNQTQDPLHPDIDIYLECRPATFNCYLLDGYEIK